MCLVVYVVIPIVIYSGLLLIVVCFVLYSCSLSYYVYGSVYCVYLAMYLVFCLVI